MGIEIYQNESRTSSLVVRDDGVLTLVTGSFPVEQDITDVPNLTELLVENGLGQYRGVVDVISRKNAPSNVRG